MTYLIVPSFMRFDLLDAVVFAMALACAWPYACRCNWLNWVRHKWTFVTLNLALSTLVVFSLYRGATGTAVPENLAAMTGAALWIVVTWPTWRFGPPEHTERPAAKVAEFMAKYQNPATREVIEEYGDRS